MKPHLGLTLVELIVAIAIVSVVLAISIPSFSPMVHRVDSSTSVNQMIGLLHYARSAAINHGTLVTLCPTADFIHCTNDWNLELMVFTDPDKDRTVSPGETLLRIQQPDQTAHWTMRPANKSYFQFDPDGTVHGTLGSLLYCHQSQAPELARRLFLNLGGRVRLSSDKDGDNVHEDNNGQALSCSL